MPDSKQVKCSICGQSIKTVAGPVLAGTAHIVCRNCFGEQTYAGSSHWGFSNTPHQQSHPSG